MSAEAEQYARLYDLFTELRGADAARRASTMADLPSSLRDELEDLLRVDEATSDGASEVRVLASVGSAAVDALEEAVPATIGPYRIVRLVAHGGQGTVYLAEQAQPKRHVALKVLRGLSLPPESLRRFEIETEALARLEHPFIAPIYDAGSSDTADGPVRYFAMKWIEGVPLDAFAASASLDVRGRLALMADVCAAVEHAHRKGIIHRDLKPANILVEADSRPQVLDFGVARATGSDLDAATLATTTGQVVGTLQFMSPEQISGDPDAIDTRSDVYALGVLLHLLLVGEVPHAGSMRSVAEAARRIQEELPTSLGRRDEALRGDVETIVAKALAKEPERRYGSAAALEEDLRRHLASQPILARPTSAFYVLGRFARRRTALMGALCALLLALVGGVVISTIFASRAREQAREAEARGTALRIETARSRITAAAAALDASDPRTAGALLDQVPPDLRDWVWRVLHARTDHSLGVVTLAGAGPETLVLAAAGHAPGDKLDLVVSGVSPNVPSASWQRVDLRTGATIASRALPPGFAHCLAATGDRVAFVRAGGVIAEVRTPSGRTTSFRKVRVRRLLGYIGGGTSIAAVARDEGGGLELVRVDVTHQQLEGRWPIDARPTRFAAASRGGAWAIATETGHIWVLPSVPGAGATRSDAHEGPVADLAFTADGEDLVSVGVDGAIVRTSVAQVTSTPVGAVGRTGPATLAAAPTGARMALMLGDGTLRVFDCRRAKPGFNLNGHAEVAPGLRPVWLDDGEHLVSLTRTGRLRRWLGSRLAMAPTLRGGAGAILALAASPDGVHVAATSMTGRLTLWDVVRLSARGHIDVGVTTGLAYSADGARLAVATRDGAVGSTVHVIDAMTGAVMRSDADAGDAEGDLHVGPAPAYAVTRVVADPLTKDVAAAHVFAGGDLRAIATAARGIEIRNHASGVRWLSLGGPTRRTTCLAVLGDDGPLLAGAEDGSIRIWRPWNEAEASRRRAVADQLMSGIDGSAWGATTVLRPRAAEVAPAALLDVELVATGHAPRKRLVLRAPSEALELRASWGHGLQMLLAGAPMAPIEVVPTSAVLAAVPAAPGADQTWDLTVTSYERGTSTGPVRQEGKPTDEEVASVVGALWCPLPNQAVGVGARWRVHSERRGMAGRERIDGVFELTAWTEAGATVRATYERASPELRKKLAGLPSTVKARATEVTEATEATFELRAGLALPASAKIARKVVIEIEVDARGVKPMLGFESRSTFEVRVRRRP